MDIEYTTVSEESREIQYIVTGHELNQCKSAYVKGSVQKYQKTFVP